MKIDQLEEDDEILDELTDRAYAIALDHRDREKNRLEKALTLGKFQTVEQQTELLDGHFDLHKQQLFQCLRELSNIVEERITAGFESENEEIIQQAKKVKSAHHLFSHLIGTAEHLKAYRYNPVTLDSGNSLRYLRQEIGKVLKSLIPSQALSDTIWREVDHRFRTKQGKFILDVFYPNDLVETALSGDPERFSMEMPFVVWGRLLGAFEVRNLFFPQILNIRLDPIELKESTTSLLEENTSGRMKTILPFAFDHHVLLLKMAVESPNADQKDIYHKVSIETNQGVDGLKKWFSENIKKVRLADRGRNWKYEPNTHFAVQILDGLKGKELLRKA